MSEQKIHILIIDDDLFSLKLLSSLVDKNGYQSHCVSDPNIALFEVLLVKPDLILLDVNMPLIDGFTICKKVREHPKIKDIPIIFVTASTEEKQIVKAFESGGSDYISKPINVHELLARLETHIKLKNQTNILNENNKRLEENVNARTLELTKAYEELTKYKQKIEKLDKAKSDFITLISHELKTPLSSILGFTELLKKISVDPKAIKYLELITSASKQLNRLSNSVVLISSLNTNIYQLHPITFDLNTAILEVISEHFSIIDSKNIQIITSLTQNINLTADLSLFKEAFKNIFENSLKFIDVNGIVEILTNKTENFINIIIEDNGCGFSDEINEKGIEFFDIKNINYHSSGMGLGLVLTKYILDAHFGKISLSQLKKGASVKLIFPCYAWLHY